MATPTIVALTAFVMKGDEEKALAAGCYGYIAKPIDTRTIPVAGDGLPPGPRAQSRTGAAEGDDHRGPSLRVT